MSSEHVLCSVSDRVPPSAVNLHAQYANANMITAARASFASVPSLIVVVVCCLPVYVYDRACSHFDDWATASIDVDGNKTWIVTDLIKTANIFRQDAVCIVKPLIAFVDYYIEKIRPVFVTKYARRGQIEKDDDRSESERTKAMHRSGTGVLSFLYP